MFIGPSRPSSAPVEFESYERGEPVVVAGFGRRELSVVTQKVEKYSFAQPGQQMLEKRLSQIFSRLFGWSEAYQRTVDALATMIKQRGVCSIICRAGCLPGGALVSEEIEIECGEERTCIYRSDCGYTGGNKPFDLEKYFISMLKKTAIVFFMAKPSNRLEIEQRIANLSGALSLILSAKTLQVPKSAGHLVIGFFKDLFRELEEFFGSDVVCSTIGLGKQRDRWYIAWSSTLPREEELIIAAFRGKCQKVCDRWKSVGRTEIVIEDQEQETKVWIMIFPSTLKPTPQRISTTSPRLVAGSAFKSGL